MSLAYRGAAGLLPMAAAGVAVSLAVHVALPASLLARAPEPEPEVRREDTGVQGAIMFDLSDIIAAPSDAGEDSVAVEEAVEAPTVTESPEAVHAARAADEPILNQTPYEVQDEDLKFGIAAPKPEQDTEEIAEEVAQEFEEEQIDQASQTGAVEAEASESSVSGVDAEAQAETAQAESEGLTAEQLAEVTEWQKAVVLRIAKAKSYPQAARKKGLEGEVRVKFTIDRYGAVTAREVDVSSGSVLLDEAALEVFDKLDRLPTPPNHLTGESFTLVIPLNYTIRKG
ncbi:energy transducer TonB family protein [Sagittula stellata]|uniref:TonB-like protein n=1 Tax=Sagittula stellata (strain ATCC 700073 / DSM 11524 / E-37) TaxID=388399 RepID=A3K4B5_SAGS3|nr:energy transducer TonB [Sagittula stellata]EBA07814.1 TonB-like protein [Sagittula stellata E-37]